MRHLIIHRQRALMGFGLSYFCILDETRERFMERLEGLTRASAMRWRVLFPLPMAPPLSFRWMKLHTLS